MSPTGAPGEEPSRSGIGGGVLTQWRARIPLFYRGDKVDTKDTSMYYNADDTLSRNRLFNFVVGARGAGKTYGAKREQLKTSIERESNLYI